MLRSLAEEFESVAQFSGIYIAEAHATDEWPIRSARFAPAPVCVRQARTQEERDAAAAEFQRAYGLPTVAADIGGSFEAAYRPWPIRVFVVSGGRLTFISEPMESAPDLMGLRQHLLSM